MRLLTICGGHGIMNVAHAARRYGARNRRPLSAAGSLPGEAQRAGLHRPRLQESGRTEGHRSGGGGCGDIRQCVPDVRHLILPSPVFNEFVTSAASRITKKSLNCTPFPAHGGPCGVFYSIFVEVVEEIIGLWEGRQCF